ncbi:hypothetical protein ABEB36_005768 [Hypothenemus hampei]|uniref:BRCT domain-containing protein n=1 Tax=Hypothenemus hampei TaxID=57062 RepID=A0ABD1EZC9_HYPHA
MPQVKIERIVSFTSEDTVHTASNILSTDISKKWKCKTAGEKCASVVLQLDQPYVITGIDIGNEHSAYVEVLVARSSAPDDFQVFLVMSSFMTPLESRQSQNVNKVRMFKQEDFIDDRRNDKWDRIKIVCSQPFNRHVQYGLAFIKLHSSDGINSEQLTQTSIGQFIIRPASPDIFAAGSLFARKKENEEKPSTLLLKGAAAIREAANSGSINPKQKHNLPVTPKPQIKKVNNEDIDRTTTSNRDTFRNELLYTKDEENNERINKVIEKRNKEKEASNKIKQDQIHANKNTPSKDMKKRKTDTPTKTPLSFKQDASSSSNTVLKRKQEQAKNVVKRVKREGKPFEKLLEDVTLVISGIQNPDRSNLRSMALAMGAKYKSDWDSTCTHLICAFINTPKFNQVKGKGKIVTRKWLDDCYSQRKKLPWRRHALDKSDKGTESEEEICEIENTPIVESLEQSSEVKSDTDEDY